MSFTTPNTSWSTDDVPGASDLNGLGNNDLYLVNGFGQSGKFDNGSDITFTTTSFALVNAALAKTVTLVGTKCLVIFQGVQVATASSQEYDINVNGTRWSSTGADGRVILVTGGTQATITVIALIDGLTPGSNTFQLVARNQAAATTTLRAGSGTANQDAIPDFAVMGN